MTAVLERPEVEVLAPEINEEDKAELCKKLCLNIFEGLIEGYEDLKLKNHHEAASIESKINEIKSEIARQKVLY